MTARSGVNRACLAIATGLVLAACGGTAGSSAPNPTPGTPATASPGASAITTSSPTPAASKGPATAQFTLVGTAGLSGPTTTQQIICAEPSLAGPQIFFLGRSAGGPQIVIFVVANHVEVRAATGSAATLRLRSFVGSGVSGFDAASGARLDTSLTETTDAATATTGIGALSSISGTIDCGDQQPGTAGVVVSGLTPFGRLGDALTSVHVGCTDTASGVFVGISGLTTAGTTPVLVFVTASAGMLQVAVETKAAGSFYTGKGAGLVTLVSGGAQIAGDVTESVAAGATTSPNTLHVSGDATCGTTVQQ